MAEITLQGNKIHTKGPLPALGSNAPNFKLVATDLSTKTLADYKGSKIILNIFLSLETNLCAHSVRKFNKEAASLNNVKVLCISKDLPFAHQRFCLSEKIENVITLSEFRDTNFGDSYNVTITEGALKGIFSRCIVIIDEAGKVIYTEQVPEIIQEPNFEKALNVLK